MIMVSGHTQRGTETTIKALSLGAVDFVSKSSSFAAEDLGHVDSELSEKLRYWARQPGRTPTQPQGPRHAAAPRPTRRPPGRPCRRSRRAARSTWSSSPPRPADRRCMSGFLRSSAPLGAPMVIAQHMPAQFTPSLANLLRSETGLDVREGAHRMALPAGSVTIIPGGGDAIVASVAEGYRAAADEPRGAGPSLRRPAVRDRRDGGAPSGGGHPDRHGQRRHQGRAQFLRRQPAGPGAGSQDLRRRRHAGAAIEAGVATEIADPRRDRPEARAMDKRWPIPREPEWRRPMSKNILVVDDSFIMRTIIKDIVESDPELESRGLCGERQGRAAEDARAQARRPHPRPRDAGDVRHRHDEAPGARVEKSQSVARDQPRRPEAGLCVRRRGIKRSEREGVPVFGS